MSGSFLDSNILVYAMDDVVLKKYEIASAIFHEAHPSDLTISFQVVNETLNVLTTKIPKPLDQDEARAFLLTMMVPIWRVYPSTELYSRALSIQARYAYGFYDSLIIAAALEAGCDRLLSEDLQHGQRIDGLIIVNPFLDA